MVTSQQVKKEISIGVKHSKAFQIRVLMLENDIKSVAELGRKMGMSRSYINGLMNAETKLDSIIRALE